MVRNSATTSASAGTSFSFQVGTATGDKNQIDITINAMSAKALGVRNNDIKYMADPSVTTPVPVGSEFLTNTTTDGDQAASSVTALADEGFVATWVGPGPGDVFGQRFYAGIDLAGVQVTGAASSRTTITSIDAAIQTVNIQRSELGAVSNRLNHTVNNLTNISSNLSAAKGGIEDADFALETTNLVKNQILPQASTAMLAQANALKENVLSLLQG